MTPNEYQQLCLTTLVTENQKDTLTMCGLGIAGEAGEVCDIIKKGLFHKGKPLDPMKLADEMGDLCWYIAVAAHVLDIEMDYVMPRLDLIESGSTWQYIALRMAEVAGFVAGSIAIYPPPDEDLKYYKDARQRDLKFIMSCIHRLALRMHFSFNDIMEMNIAKLQARHSDGQATANGGVFNPHYQSDTVQLDTSQTSK